MLMLDSRCLAVYVCVAVGSRADGIVVDVVDVVADQKVEFLSWDLMRRKDRTAAQREDGSASLSVLERCDKMGTDGMRKQPCT
jgi:hypothetical protein